ncbi:MAG: 2Fe-2S iron-sulfur cluster binding domain-containing protein [Spirochaetales bacterium]|nr:2Fe-2S iron-sulfur cluster binding domain-containing protein [Spirochaetales bacterium]
MIIPFELNGRQVYIDANPGERLVQILRRRFSLLDAKEGCLSGRCGSCTVLLDGKPVASCIVPVFLVRHGSVETLESFSKTEAYRDIKDGFAEAGVEMCGFCNAGKILHAHYLLEVHPRPTVEEIQACFTASICRCTSMEDLIEGVKKAAAIRRRRSNRA